MKKNILYIGIAVVIGLVGGYLLFGNNANTSNQELSDSHHHFEEAKNQLWTCSMHPQIIQAEPGDCPICGMELIPAESGAEGLAVNEIKMTKNAMALANVQTTIVGNEIADNEGMISLSGKITENKDETATQPAHFDGRIEQLYVNSLGEKVNRGQKVASIYSPALVAAQQELITTFKLKELQPQLYDAVRNKFKNWRIHGDVLDKIESSGQVIQRFPIYSHVSGVITEIMLNEGAHVMDGMSIFKVSNLSSVWADFDAYENQISQFKIGQKIKIVTNAYPNKEFEATVSFIDPILNKATRTVTVRATLKNTEDLFKPGMFVNGKLQGLTEKNSELISVPATAVLWTGERSLVYIKTNLNEPIFEMREVTIGNRNGENFTITHGLENGDEIVTNGTFTVDAAAQLQGKKSMMNKSGGKTMTGHEEYTSMQMNREEKLDGGTTELPKSVQKNFLLVLNSYSQLKDAFVQSDIEKVKIATGVLLKDLEKIKISSLTETQKEHFGGIDEALNAILEDADLENQRVNFVVLNESIIPVAMNMSTMNPPFYVQKCPMANQNKGALWLSESREIKNPYYGDEMLTCGSVIDTIGK
ncbi:efflux RND transporter periplasmic adaptor subunit [Maribacter antarcticus]|uniref:efflux RND transporter periplasmic adaptor subunit n=1 Tax=Maribacter antarcticus TaxID=505250 RepID=UPI00047DEBD0|nr:efflux RND transporter periplasmic adaptor subunit [Maribacter antarcticus]